MSSPRTFHSFWLRLDTTLTMTDSSLSKLLKARYWETVLNRIEENPQEAQENCKKKNTVLHVAIYQRAPAHLIIAILRAFPEAAQRVNWMDETPLFAACREGAAPEVFEALLLVYPEPCETKLRMVLKKLYPKDYYKCNMDYHDAEHAATAEIVMDMLEKGVAFWKKRQAIPNCPPYYQAPKVVSPPPAQPMMNTATEPEIVVQKNAVEILRELGLEDYKEVFEENGVETHDDVVSLTAEDLKEMEFKIGSRNRLLKWIQANQQQNQSIHINGSASAASSGISSSTHHHHHYHGQQQQEQTLQEYVVNESAKIGAQMFLSDLENLALGE